MAAASSQSKLLTARQFGHALSEDAIPVAVLAGVHRRATATDPAGYIEDVSLRLGIGGIEVGNNLARLGEHWPSALSTVWYGGTLDDAWSIPGLTAGDINSAEFSVMLKVFGKPNYFGPSNSVSAEVDVISTRIYFTEAQDENRLCFSERSLDVGSLGTYRQHPTDDVWGRVVEEGSPPTAPPASGGRKGRAIIVPSQGDLQSLADAGDNKASLRAFGRRAYLFAREAAD